MTRSRVLKLQRYYTQVREVIWMLCLMQSDYCNGSVTVPGKLGANITFVLRMVFLIWFAYRRLYNS